MNGAIHQYRRIGPTKDAYLDGMLEDGLVSGLEGEAEAAVHLPQHHPELPHHRLPSI